MLIRAQPGHVHRIPGASPKMGQPSLLRLQEAGSIVPGMRNDEALMEVTRTGLLFRFPSPTIREALRSGQEKLKPVRTVRKRWLKQQPADCLQKDGVAIMTGGETSKSVCLKKLE